jgi:hypothetical protein
MAFHAAPALAQSSPAAGPAPRGSVRNQMMHGVLVPSRGVDPGMTVKTPRMPPQSTPVIRPKATTPDGTTVVVPK